MSLHLVLPLHCREKVAALQGLLGVSDEHVSAKLGSLAVLLDHDIDSLRPRFSLLLELTGELS